MKMKLKAILLFLLMFSAFTNAQKKSKGDYFFFEYAYKDAIKEYTKELSKNSLSNQQYLNLADSYLKVGNYTKAAQLYEKQYQKDTTLATPYINKLLLSISKTKSRQEFTSYTENFSNFFSKELKDNADFNFEILEDNTNKEQDFLLFNCYLNSPQADFSPAFYKDELLFTSGRTKAKGKIYEPSGESYLDIYSGKVQADGDVTVPTVFKRVANSKYHKATPFYSEALKGIIYMLSNADGDNLLFDNKGKNTLAIGLVSEKGKFEYLLRDLSTSFYYPYYEAATSKLYFAANFEGGFGGTDIYYVHTNNGQIMSAPINLGPKINSSGNEIAPFIFEGSLFFSSDIFYGLGGMDMYTSNITADGFSTPVNLGKGINSTYDDFGFIIKKNEADNLYVGYFSSNREGGKGKDDIYGFKVTEKPGLKTIVIKGVVVNPANNRAIEEASITLLDEDENILKQAVSDVEGNYEFEIPFRKGYAVKAYKKGHGRFYEKFLQEEEVKAVTQNVKIGLPFIQDVVEEKENKTVIKLQKFYFAKGSSTITPAIASELDKVAAVVVNFPNIRLKVESHTNSRGSDARNLALSQDRATAVKNYLLSKGVATDNVAEYIGYGENLVINQCKNGVYCLEFLHNQNDRTLITVLNYDELN
ncbi:OmpA family protein [Cellulophaga sp. E6(2014)]|uniref:OmpA family protein n=1 Tax=Cellulophaga sp. E6(2014) TaxID=1495334 RepID=UPI001F3DFD41|nr:OmpA family protein [Cellulophaga sp. E6(2014)]